MLTHPTIAALHFFLASENGQTMNQIVWSVGFILLVGALCVFVGPEIGADWREFVGRPTK